MSSVISDFYEHHKEFGINSLRRRKIHALAASVLSGGGKRVLDVGCTTGFVSKPLHDAGNYVVGIDIAKKAIEDARKVLDEAYVADIEQFPWPTAVTNRSYDLIIVSEVIEHLFDPAALLSALMGMLSPGGVILVTTPNLLVWNWRARMTLGTYENDDPGHIRMFSYRTFRALCAREGFRVTAEDHVWHPNWVERFKSFAPKNLFVYQIIALLEPA